MTDFPWSPGSASGIGSLPGIDITESIATVFGELPDLPYLPELPDRGAGADMIGRGAGLLVAMPVELYAGQWRVASHPGLEARRTRDLWSRDLDALTDYAGDFEGLIKVQAAGPWTLAASVDLAIGGRMLRDPGAVRDLTASLAEGIAGHVADVGARLPHARVLLQLDEPSLPAVLAGRVPSESGLDRLRSVDSEVARAALRRVIDAAGVPVVVHCCAPNPPLTLLREAGAAGVAVDLDLLTDYDELGEILEDGVGLFAGAVPTGVGAGSRGAGSARGERAHDRAPEDRAARSRSSDLADRDERERRDDSDEGPASAGAVAAADRIRDLWKKIGFSINDLPLQVVVTPACGLAGASIEGSRAAMATCRDAARRLADD